MINVKEDGIATAYVDGELHFLILSPSTPPICVPVSVMTKAVAAVENSKNAWKAFAPKDRHIGVVSKDAFHRLLAKDGNTYG